MSAALDHGPQGLAAEPAVALDAAAPAADPARAERQRLLKLEREVAARHMDAPMWGYAVFALGGFALWMALFPLAAAGIIPLWLGFIASCVLATGGYVTSHEAMHSNIARKGEKLRWLNELSGRSAPYR